MIYNRIFPVFFAVLTLYIDRKSPVWITAKYDPNTAVHVPYYSTWAEAIRQNAEFIHNQGDLLKLFVYWYLHIHHYQLIFENKVSHAVFDEIFNCNIQ